MNDKRPWRNYLHTYYMSAADQIAVNPARSSRHLFSSFSSPSFNSSSYHSTFLIPQRAGPRMQDYRLDASILAHAVSKTVIITGAANGIGAATATLFNAHDANVVISDLESCREKAESLIQSFAHPDRAVFIPADVLNWTDMITLFNQTAQKFGPIDIVIANAGTMESSAVLDLNDVDDEGNLKESTEGFKVIDINLKGTLNSTSHHIDTQNRLANHRESPSPRNVSYEIQKYTRLNRTIGVHVWLFRRHWSRCLRSLQARCHRPSSGFPADVTKVRDPSQCRRAFLYPDADHGWVCAEVGGGWLGCKHAAGRCGDDCECRSG